MGSQGATTPSDSAEFPILLDGVDESVETALAVGLVMPGRSVIDATTRGLIGHLRVLMGEDLGFEEDPAVQVLFQEGYRVLDLTRRPTAESTHFGAYQYMRELGLLTRRFADVYRETQEKKDEADGWRSPHRSARAPARSNPARTEASTAPVHQPARPRAHRPAT